MPSLAYLEDYLEEPKKKKQKLKIFWTKSRRTRKESMS